MALTAATCALLLSGFSYHLDRSVDWNESHEIQGVACGNVSVMAFKNSYGERSLGLGYDLTAWQSGNGRLELGAYGAIWTGYEVEGWAGGVRPIAGARATWNVTRHLSVVGTTAGVLTAVHLEWSF